MRPKTTERGRRWRILGSEIITDSRMGRREALADNSAFPCPREILAAQVVLSVWYVSFDGRVHEGRLVVHGSVATAVQRIFKSLLRAKFPIQSVIPVADPRFAWDDAKSMAANNSSGFNYRYKDGTAELSWHAYGLAIDLNPVQNPYIRGKIVQPAGAVYDRAVPGTLTPDSLPVRLFKQHGFKWGGDWRGKKDYQHFEWPHPAPRQPR